MKSFYSIIYLFIYQVSFSQHPVNWTINYSPQKKIVIFNATIERSPGLFNVNTMKGKIFAIPIGRVE